jgi:hypothetical protein
MKITVTNLRKSQYRRHTPPGFSNADVLWQKAITTESGVILFYLNIYQYVNLFGDGRDSFMPDAQIYLLDDCFMNFLLGGFKEIEAVETFARRLFDAVGGRAYGER